MHIMPGVLGADKRISSSQGDGGRENRGELECLSLSLPAHPASRGSRARKQFNLFATVKIQRQQASFFQMEKGGGAGQEEEDCGNLGGIHGMRERQIGKG